MTTRRCPSCMAPLPEEGHREETIRTESGFQIPVIVCPQHPRGTLTLGLPEAWTLDAPEPPLQGAPVE